MKMRPVVLIPALKHHSWGGTKLSADYGKSAQDGNISESWELSCQPDGLTRVDDVLCPYTFSETLKKYGWLETIGTKWQSQTEFPLLVKLIDAQQASPITVCPDEGYARENEDSCGRTKLIYITDCRPGSYIFYGVSSPTSIDEFSARLNDKTVTHALKVIPVKKGDSFLIEPGTIHGLSAGCTAVEIQQGCNLAYTVWDYDRPHSDDDSSINDLDKLIDVMNLFPSKKVISVGHISKTPYFTVDRFRCDKTLFVDEKSFLLLICLEGAAELKWSKGSLPITKGSSVFIPADTGEYQLTGSAAGLTVTL